MPAGQPVDSALNWSVYLSDFGRYMLPASAAARPSLSDCNVSYKRDALETIRRLWGSEFHENVVNGALREAGATLWFDPGMVVFESRDLTLAAAVRDRFTYGRLFGSTVVRGQRLGPRLIKGVAALFLAPILVWRVARHAFTRRRHRNQVVRSAGYLLLVSTVWLAGESLGRLTGRSGRVSTPRESH
jgi:hypothetical protein